eukprot:704474-Rhodomonas_salina.1
MLDMFRWKLSQAAASRKAAAISVQDASHAAKKEAHVPVTKAKGFRNDGERSNSKLSGGRDSSLAVAEPSRLGLDFSSPSLEFPATSKEASMASILTLGVRVDSNLMVTDAGGILGLQPGDQVMADRKSASHQLLAGLGEGRGDQ